MYTKYYNVWKEHSDRYGPRTALLYQVGGFYEIYDTENLTTGRTLANIREVAELCQLSLTVHPVAGSPDTQTLFGGVPDYALAKYEKILVTAGFTVVVVGQRKNSRGAVEDRVVDHISSPGLYVDGSVTERRLVGVVLESLEGGAAALRRVYWAAAALDLATGRIWFVEGADRDRLHQFLCMHPPAEMVIWSDGGVAAAALTESLRSACSATHLRCLVPSNEAVELAVLDRHWAPATKRLAAWIGGAPQARRALAALMDFAGDHVPSSLAALDLPEAWIPDGEVRLGNAALEQLGLLSLRSGDEKQSLLGLMDQCRSVAGRRLMRARLMRPISDVGILRARLAAVTVAGSAAIEKTAPTERCLRSLYDMSRLWRRLELGSADIGAMACLLRSYESAATLMEAWNAPPAGALQYLAEVAREWDLATVTEMAREGVSIPVAALPWVSGPAYTEVATLFAEGRAIRREAEDLCGIWTGLGRKEALYLDDAEGGGFRVTGTKRRVASVVAAIRDEGDTTAKVTPYKTTALIETAGLEAISARHRDWMKRWTPVWSSAWADSLAALVVRGRTAHAAIETWCAELDLAWTVARLAREWNWVHPEFVDATSEFIEDSSEGTVEGTAIRHPLIERLTQTPYVPHSIALSPTQPVGDVTWTPRGLLLYGMNASGKSSLMKALGLAVLLAQCGFPVPAQRLRLAPFTAIFTRILGNDNLWAGLSSFAVEMTEFREILRFADERSLVLGDELCSGTESLSATALVAAGVETLGARGTKFVFATHLHDLSRMLDVSSVRAVHLKVRYDAGADRLIYDRSLAPGSGSALYGLEVCRALDLPTEYLERAMSLRKSLEGNQVATGSVYSAAAVVERCEVCGSRTGLETHHIRHQADGGGHEPSNLVCLCTGCHDDHHAGRLVIERWEDTSAGRQLKWNRVAATATPVPEEILIWVREQRQLRVRVPTIQRMAKQIFGVQLTESLVRATR
jgi:DNA mismatch repair protein MutS